MYETEECFMMIKPELRFNGFKGEWEETSLGNLFAERVESDINAEMLSVTMHDGIIKASENGRYDNSNSDRSNYKLVLKDDIAYNSMRMWQGASGCSPYRGIVSPAYTVIIPNKGINSTFFAAYFKTNRLINKFRLNSQGLTTDTWNLKYSAFSVISVLYPKDEKEQQQIATYFVALDKQISSSSSRLASLKQVKAASLQAMFPQKGEKVPKIRFNGFEGEWEEQNAGLIFKTINERNFPHLPVVSATQDKGVVTRDSIGYNIFHDTSNETTYKHIAPGQFVIHLRSFQGGFAYSAIEGICSPAYTIMDFKDKRRNHGLYWKYVLTSNDFIKRLELITYGIRDGRTISFDEFKEMNFLIPSIEEQQQIAAYFTALDKQIALQTQRLEKLKQIKAACLDKMFV